MKERFRHPPATAAAHSPVSVTGTIFSETGQSSLAITVTGAYMRPFLTSPITSFKAPRVFGLRGQWHGVGKLCSCDARSLNRNSPTRVEKVCTKLAFHQPNFSLHNKKSMAAGAAYHTLYLSNNDKPGVCGILTSPRFVFVVWATSVMSHGAIKSTTGGDGIFS